MKDIKGFEGKYAVTEDGRVWSYPKKWRNLKHDGQWMNDSNCSGYRGLTLRVEKSDKRFLIHRIVAETFIPNPKGLSQVNHKDGDKGNNAVNNLEWVSPSENQIHASKIGLMPKGEKHHSRKLTDKSVRDIRENVVPYTENGFKAFAKKYKVNQSTIHSVFYRKGWKHICS